MSKKKPNNVQHTIVPRVQSPVGRTIIPVGVRPAMIPTNQNPKHVKSDIQYRQWPEQKYPPQMQHPNLRAEVQRAPITHARDIEYLPPPQQPSIRGNVYYRDTQYGHDDDHQKHHPTGAVYHRPHEERGHDYRTIIINSGNGNSTEDLAVNNVEMFINTTIEKTSFKLKDNTETMSVHHISLTLKNLHNVKSVIDNRPKDGSIAFHLCKEFKEKMMRDLATQTTGDYLLSMWCMLNVPSGHKHVYSPINTTEGAKFMCKELRLYHLVNTTAITEEDKTTFWIADFINKIGDAILEHKDNFGMTCEMMMIGTKFHTGYGTYS